MTNFANLEYLEPYDASKELYVLTDASYSGLEFILFQHKANGQGWCIVMVGSTTLKGSQKNWYPSELELLAIDYMFTKTHFWTFSTTHPVVLYSDCSGLKSFENMDLHSIKNKRFMQIKESLSCYN